MSSSIFDGEDTIVGVLWLLTEIAAINWALFHFFDINLVVEAGEIVGGTTLEAVLYGLIGIAGVLALADSLGIWDMADVVGNVLGR